MMSIVYFKDSGEQVKIKAEVEKVIQFFDLAPKQVGKILEKYGEADGIGKEKIKFFSIHLKIKSTAY